MMAKDPSTTVSIVSHGHGRMVAKLTEQFLALTEVSCIIVTFNIAERLELPEDPRLQVLHNEEPKGFGANHNAAFARCRTGFFCVVNPDIELIDNPLPDLINALDNPETALVAPMVHSASGQVEDSWRRFPSPVGLVLKAVFGRDGTYPDAAESAHFAPDWVAGMFLMFRSSDYEALSGFDENFFLYYEDVDICARLRSAQRGIIGCTQTPVVHKAQRASWSSWRYRKYHVSSLLRYFSRDWRRFFPKILRGSAHQS